MKPEILSVVVPVYSHSPYLADMFELLFLDGIKRNAGRRVELVVIDDASPLRERTEAAAAAARGWADVVYHRNEENLGYLRSANKGLSLASGGRILLCNSDTRLTPGALAGLESALAISTDTGIAGPAMNGAFSSPLQQAGGSPELSSFAQEELLRLDDFGRTFPRSGASVREAGWLVGCCLLMRRELVDAVGLFDESFGFGYMEEIDYAIRARRAGWKLRAAGNAFVFHGGLRRPSKLLNAKAGSQTGGHFPLKVLIRMALGLWRFRRKYGKGSLVIPQDAEGAAKKGF